MNYKKLYQLLKASLLNYSIWVLDDRALAYCAKIKKEKALIVIHPDSSWKDKLLSLAHETGHMFKFGKEMQLKWSWDGDEETANKFAIEYLKKIGVSSKIFYNHYTKACRYSRTGKLK